MNTDDRETRIEPFELASLLPAFVSQDRKSGQQCQQHETDGHGPGKAHSCHSTSWQGPRRQQTHASRMAKGEASVRSTWPSSCDVLWDLCLSFKGFQVNHSCYFFTGQLTKKCLILSEADGTTNIHLIAQANTPGVILDSSSSSPQPPSWRFPLRNMSSYTTSTATPEKATIIPHLAS